LETDQDPNPTRETRPPPFSVFPTLPINDSSAAFAAALEMPASAAIASINSDLFIILKVNYYKHKFIRFPKRPMKKPLKSPLLLIKTNIC
jgi:hypothetical protein